jgi:CHAT domain-containing protein
LINLSEQIKSIRHSESLIEERASESNYKDKSKDYRIIHFGTHGLLNEKSPLFSKLVLVKDSIEDGYLHIYEIYGQNLNAELAVLSACNSGKGKVESSDGIVSLTQAFTHAGCPSVLMTLWEVDEKSTSEILALFYDNLQNGQRKSEALRNAKLSFLENASFQYQDPYYWAGLVVIGNDTPIFTASSSYFEVLFIIFLIVILAVYTQKFLARKKGG